jgi:hypothetical protein
MRAGPSSGFVGPPSTSSHRRLEHYQDGVIVVPSKHARPIPACIKVIEKLALNRFVLEGALKGSDTFGIACLFVFVREVRPVTPAKSELVRLTGYVLHH